jgi:hypothetical protein
LAAFGHSAAVLHASISGVALATKQQRENGGQGRATKSPKAPQATQGWFKLRKRAWQDAYSMSVNPRVPPWSFLLVFVVFVVVLVFVVS